MPSRKRTASPTSEVEVVEDLLVQVRARFARLLVKQPGVVNTFIEHLRSMARFYEEPMDYPEPANPKFPTEIPIAFAVCHPACGAAEFIVEGSTQECQHCGGLMFRTDAPVMYRRSAAREPTSSRRSSPHRQRRRR